MAGGRPTDYRPEFCDIVIREMQNGASKTEVAYVLNICKDTLYKWAEKHAEFADALKKGKDLSEGWWRINGRVNLENKDFNPTLWYMNMKNRFGWKDKTESVATVTVKAETQDAIEFIKSRQKDV